MMNLEVGLRGSCNRIWMNMDILMQFWERYCHMLYLRSVDQAI